jgi:hypothetical protein
MPRVRNSIGFRYPEESDSGPRLCSDSAFDEARPEAASQSDLPLVPEGKHMAVLVVEQLKA